MVVPYSINLCIVGASTSTTNSERRLLYPLDFRTYFIITDAIISYKRLHKFIYFSLLLSLFFKKAIVNIVWGLSKLVLEGKEFAYSFNQIWRQCDVFNQTLEGF